MAIWDRIVSLVGGRRIIQVLGGFYLVLAIGWFIFQVSAGAPVINQLILFVLIAGPGFVLLYVGYILPRLNIRDEFYPSVARWVLRGFGIMAAILLFYSLQPGERVDSVSSIVILTALASVAGLAAGIHDAKANTRARELEETIEQLKTSNERLEQFAYAASHDLQEPLRMVSSYLQLIEQRYGDELDEDGLEFLKYAVDGADRMRGMVDGLLMYSRVETRGEEFEPVDLDDVFEDARENLGLRIEEADAEIAKESLPTVEGDAEQLRQVFQNLLDNAIEYSGDERPRIHVGATRDGTSWEISVRDEGIGIEPDDQERIFEVFQRLHSRGEHPGSGIGLAICERIIERHDGEIRVDSEPGEGSTFSFVLPADAEVVRHARS